MLAASRPQIKESTTTRRAPSDARSCPSPSRLSRDAFGKLIHHNGALMPYGFASQVGFLPSSGLSAVFLSNRPPTAAPPRRIGAQTGEWLSSFQVPPSLQGYFLTRGTSSRFGACVRRARVRRVRPRIECGSSGGAQASHGRSARFSSVSCRRVTVGMAPFYLQKPEGWAWLGFNSFLLAGALATRWWTLPSLRWSTRTADEKWTCVTIGGFLLLEVCFLEPYQLTVFAIALGIEATAAEPIGWGWHAPSRPGRRALPRRCSVAEGALTRGTGPGPPPRSRNAHRPP